MGYLLGCNKGHTWWYSTDALPCPKCGSTVIVGMVDERPSYKCECPKGHIWWTEYELAQCSFCGNKNIKIHGKPKKE